MYTSFVLYFAKLVSARFIESSQFRGKFDLLTLIAQTQAKKKKKNEHLMNNDNNNNKQLRLLLYYSAYHCLDYDSAYNGSNG